MSLSTKAVKAIIENEKGELLFLQRNPKRSGVDNWDFPGGLIEDGEDERIALIRECREELGVDVEIINLGKEWRFFRFSDNQWVKVQNYYCNIIGGTILLSDEHIDYNWVKKNDVKNYSVKDNSFYESLK